MNRGFKKGDIEYIWKNGECTGRVIEVTVISVTKEIFDMSDNVVIMSIKMNKNK